jgi:DNA-directed RNA polymerase subunit RPC12/RpoP
MVTVVSTQPHHSVVKQVICGNCGSTLEYVPRDIKSRTVSDYTGDRDTVYYIQCPECNDKVTVKRY